MEMVVDEDVRPHEVALWEVLACAAGAQIDYMLSMDENSAAPTPRQRELVDGVYRRARRQLRTDRLWVLGMALPLKGLVLRWGLRARGPVRPAVSGGAVGALTVVTLRYMLRRKP